MSNVANLGSRHVGYIYNLHLATIKHSTIHLYMCRQIYMSFHGSYEISKYQSILSSIPRGKNISGNQVEGVHLAEFFVEKNIPQKFQAGTSKSPIIETEHISSSMPCLQFFVVLQTCFALIHGLHLIIPQPLLQTTCPAFI